MKLTPREIQLYVEGVNEYRNDEWKGDLYLMWRNAQLHRVEAKNFPSLADVLPKPPLTPLERAMRTRETMDKWREASNRTERRKAKAKENAAKPWVPPWTRKGAKG